MLLAACPRRSFRTTSNDRSSPDDRSAAASPSSAADASRARRRLPSTSPVVDPTPARLPSPRDGSRLGNWSWTVRYRSCRWQTAAPSRSVPCTPTIQSHPAAFRWTPGTTTWVEIEPLNKPRSQFGSTLLRDGRVLVAGGLNDASQSFSSAYVFDPERSSDGWSKVGLLDTARTAPSIATLPDGRVLLAGGYFRTNQGFGSVSPVRGLGSPRRDATLGIHHNPTRRRRHRRCPRTAMRLRRPSCSIRIPVNGRRRGAGTSPRARSPRGHARRWPGHGVSGPARTL